MVPRRSGAGIVGRRPRGAGGAVTPTLGLAVTCYSHVYVASNQLRQVDRSAI